MFYRNGKKMQGKEEEGNLNVEYLEATKCKTPGA